MISSAHSISVSSRVLGSHSLAVFFMGSWVPFTGCLPFFSFFLTDQSRAPSSLARCLRGLRYRSSCRAVSGDTTTLTSVFSVLITVCLFFVSAFVSTVVDELSTAPWTRATSSLFLTNTVSSRGLCHLLTLCFPPIVRLLLQHLSVLLISNPPTGSSVSQGVKSFAVIHHPEPDPVCQSVVFHHPSTCSSYCLRYDCGFPFSHISCQLLFSTLFNLSFPLLLLLPFPWSPDHHISLQSRP